MARNTDFLILEGGSGAHGKCPFVGFKFLDLVVPARTSRSPFWVWGSASCSENQVMKQQFSPESSV